MVGLVGKQPGERELLDRTRVGGQCQVATHVRVEIHVRGRYRAGPTMTRERMSDRRVSVRNMSEPLEADPQDESALAFLGHADSIDDEPYERDQMLARAQVHATLAVAFALRDVAEAIRTAGEQTARSMPSTSGLPELLAEISQGITQIRH